MGESLVTLPCKRLLLSLTPFCICRTYSSEAFELISPSCSELCREIEMLRVLLSSAAVHRIFNVQFVIRCHYYIVFHPLQQEKKSLLNIDGNDALHHAGCAHWPSAEIYSYFKAQQRKRLVGPAANLMHVDILFRREQNGGPISRWQSGSLQSGSLRGPRGKMACNCVRVPPELKMLT